MLYLYLSIDVNCFIDNLTIIAELHKQNSTFCWFSFLLLKNLWCIQEPEVLIDWYNCVIEWLADVASHDSLQLLSWPVPEFTGNYCLAGSLFCMMSICLRSDFYCRQNFCPANTASDLWNDNSLGFMSDVIFHDWNEGFKLQFFSGSADVKLECYTTVCLFGDYIIIIDVNCKLIYNSQGIFS